MGSGRSGPGAAPGPVSGDRAADSVMRAAELVELRMGERLGVEDMARAACYSPFYFSRLFARATGHSPYDYLMRRRVAASAEEVVSGSRSLTDIALDYGFEAPDGFARAFRRCFGSAPSELRREGAIQGRIARAPLDRGYVERMLSSGIPAPEPISAAAETLVGTWAIGPEAVESAIERALEGPSPKEAEEPLAIIVERGDDLRPLRAFVARRSGDGVPAYPLSATEIPGGTRARFASVRDGEGLRFLLEFAYRAWLPAAGRASAPAYDLLAECEGGGLSLVLPLA